MDPLSLLSLLLRPAGGGLYLVSTGRSEQLALQRRLYGAESDEAVAAAHRADLARIAGARVLMLGIPSDVGAGFRRGANLGPQAIRSALFEAEPDFPERSRREGIVDLGDVLCVPQLLSDEMLSDAQLAASRRALYPSAPPELAAQLPVSPLSIAERALDLALSIAPDAALLVLGGDHSVAWPVTAALHRARPGFGIVQMDAHTDLLPERLGVRICFATWTYHANELLGRGGKVIQVGIRASRFGREHWERENDVRQLWAADAMADPAAAIEQVVRWVRESGVREIYFSNDIDGTDAAFADATGTPEPDGLHPDLVVGLIERLGREVRIGAADIVEVAPPLSARATTTETALRYLQATLAALRHAPG